MFYNNHFGDRNDNLKIGKYIKKATLFKEFFVHQNGNIPCVLFKFIVSNVWK